MWKQWQITFEIDKKRVGWLEDNLDKWHSRGNVRNRSQACQWSRIEKFRYLETLYKFQPKLFDISAEQFESKRNEFYANQAMVATLPFEK